MVSAEAGVSYQNAAVIALKYKCWFNHMKKKIESPRIYSYISLSKVASFEKELKRIEGGGVSVLGIGGSLKISRPQSLQERVNAIIDGISEDDENFQKFQGQFIEVIMGDVVIYVCSTKEQTIIMGGSSVYTQFNDKRLPPIEYVGGSNRTSLVRRMTEWWEEFYSRKGIITKDNTKVLNMTWKDYTPNAPVADTIIFSKKPENLLEIADWMYNEYSHSHLAGNMEMMSVIYSSLLIKSSCDVNHTETDKKELIVGSPIYVCQTSPSKM